MSIVSSDMSTYIFNVFAFDSKQSKDNGRRKILQEEKIEREENNELIIFNAIL